MVYHFIHEVAVVTYHDYTSLKVLQIFFENLQSYDVEVVCRLVEYQEVRILHQYSAQIQSASFASTQLIHIAVLRFGSEEEVLQELRCCETFAVAQFYNFGYGGYHVYNFHLLVELQTVLRVIAETYSLANIQCSAVYFFQAHQYLYESRLAGSVVSYDTHLFISCKDVREIVEYLQ